MTYKDALQRIKSHYGLNVDQMAAEVDRICLEAATLRVGSGHEESAGATNRCGKCGILEATNSEAAEQGIDPIYHPECYLSFVESPETYEALED